MEGDSEIVVNSLKKESFSMVSFCHLIQDAIVFGFMQYFFFFFSHVRRDRSSIAHNIARHAIHVTSFFGSMEDVLPRGVHGSS